MKENKKLTHFYGRFDKEIIKKLESLSKYYHTSKNSAVMIAIEFHHKHLESFKKLIGDKP